MITQRDYRIVHKLAALCEESTIDLRCRHIAAVASKNKIISIGVNQTKTCPWFYKVSKRQEKCYYHSEHSALKNLKGNLKGCTLFSVRVDRLGEWNQARPCEICEKIIKMSGIKRVVYTVAEGLKEEMYA